MTLRGVYLLNRAVAFKRLTGGFNVKQ